MNIAQTLKVKNPVGSRPRYWPIGQYAVIGDCRTAALVGPDGSIDWLCMPYFDSPAVLCRMLDDDKGGYFRVSPVGEADVIVSYLDASNILESVFEAPSGRLRVVDYMPIRARRGRATRGGSVVERLAHALPGIARTIEQDIERDLGNDVSAAHRINRQINCLGGDIAVEVLLKVSFDYARERATIEHHSLPNGGAAAILNAGGRYLIFALTYQPSERGKPSSDEREVHLVEQDGTLRAEVRMHAGDRVNASLSYARTAEEASELLTKLKNHDFDADLDETLVYWRRWAAECCYDGPYQANVLRSALALKLCIFEPTGAIVAAPTTSLPEAIGGVRNWDYRYTWLRDSAFTLDALGQLGYYSEARDYFHFLHDLHVARDIDNMRLMYGIHGETGEHLAEHTLDHLSGYRDSRPVRVGNGAATQHQLDIYGELLDAAYSYVHESGFRHGFRRAEADRDLRDLTARVARYVVQHWQEKDEGIWEVRGGPRAFVYSRVMCWVAMERALQIVNHHGSSAERERWAQVRDEIHANVLRYGYSEEVSSFTQTYEGHALDAADLRLPLVHFLAEDDPRVVSTVNTIGEKLAGPGGLVYRYEPTSTTPGDNLAQAEHALDGLPGAEGAFLACTFWLVSDLCLIGRIDEARERFERLLTYSSPLGLFSEEVDPHSGDLLGNYPQAFTHIGLINSAATLQRAQEGRLVLRRGDQTKG